MKDSVKYYFSFHIWFKKDVDVFSLSKKFDLSPYKLTLLKDSKGNNKSAKMWYKTDDLTNIYTGDEFEKFVVNLSEIFKELNEYLILYDGSCEFCITFTQLNEKPCIDITKKTINALNKLGASVDFDFYV